MITVQKIHMGQEYEKEGRGFFFHTGGTMWFVMRDGKVIQGAWNAKWAAEWAAQQIDPEFKLTSAPKGFR